MSRQGAPVRRTQRMPLNRPALVGNGWAALAAVGEQWVQNVPFRVRQIAPIHCYLPKKGSFESFTYEKIVNTP
jgi:hypothetical protein